MIKIIWSIIKSTVPAYKLQAIQEQCVDLRVVYNPEFLTEKNYIEDFKNPPMHVFGGRDSDNDIVEKLYLEHSDCKPCPIFKTDIVWILLSCVLFFMRFF